MMVGEENDALGRAPKLMQIVSLDKEKESGLWAGLTLVI